MLLLVVLHIGISTQVFSCFTSLCEMAKPFVRVFGLFWIILGKIMWYSLFVTILLLHHISPSAYGNYGESLVLTPYLPDGSIEEGRQASLVTLEGFESTTSYSGFFTVDEMYGSNLFFWFFPSQNDPEIDPVLLWLQGGPGLSSLFGLFNENGPIVVNDDKLSLRDASWTNNHSVIYIDSPVGTGFSYTNGGYAQDETTVGEHVYEALIQFFTLFPDYQKNPFFVAGESYAGKYVPAVSYTIHKRNLEAELKINLMGILISNGFMDPINQVVGYGDYLYEIGLIDDNAKAEFEKSEGEISRKINQGEFTEAFQLFDRFFNGDFKTPTMYQSTTGLSDCLNYVYSFKNVSTYVTLFESPAIRKAIHVGNKPFTPLSKQVRHHLYGDILRSVAPWISELLNYYRVLVFNGQLSVVVPYRLTVNFLKHLNFSGAEEYKTAPRKVWRVDDEVAGFVKVAGNLTEVLLRNAGHYVSIDQPLWVLDLVGKFVRNITIA